MGPDIGGGRRFGWSGGCDGEICGAKMLADDCRGRGLEDGIGWVFCLFF